MSEAEKLAFADEIFKMQPNLLASCFAQPKLGVAMESVEFLLNILFVCYQAMKESGHHWPLISEDEQDRQMARHTAAVKFSEELSDTTLARTARDLYIADHTETPLLAFVLNETRAWLRDLASRRAESESDKYVMMAAVNLVNCIAAVGRPERV